MRPSKFNRFAENAFLIYLTFLALFTLLFRNKITDWEPIFFSEVLAAIVIVVVVRLQQARPEITGLTLVRNWLLVPFVLYGYRVENFLINCQRNPGFLPDRDSWLIAADRFIFSVDPTVWLQKITFPWLTELLQLIYATDYFLPLILALVLYLRKRRIPFQKSIFILIAGYLLSYLGYFLIPAIGPRFTIPHSVPLHGILFREKLRDLIYWMEACPRDCFPSGHTEIPLLTLWLAHRYQRKIFRIYLPIVIGMIFSTVYLRFHYVVDIFAGAALAGGIILAAKLIEGGIKKKKNKKRLKLFLLGTALFLAAGAAILAGFEVYLRLNRTRIIQQSRDGSFSRLESDAEFLIDYTPKGRRLIPDSRVLIKNHRISGRDVVMEINSLGFRGEEIPREKMPDEFRVLVLGDSITWASYLSEEETYVKRMEEYLQKLRPGRKVKVINAGVGDIGLNEELDILKERGLATRPDLVILAFYLNDSRPPWGFCGELGKRGWLRRHSLLAETIYKNIKLRRWIKEKSEDRLAWTSAMNKLNWSSDRRTFLRLAGLAKYDWGAAWDPASWEVIDRGLEELQALSERNNFTVVVAALPVAFQVYAAFLEDTPQRILREKVKRRGFFFLDLLPFLRKYRKEEKDLYYDWCHPTGKTADFIARVLAGFLKENEKDPRWSFLVEDAASDVKNR